MTDRYRNRDSPVVISSRRPSANDSVSASPDFLKGSTATQDPAVLIGAASSRAASATPDEDGSWRLKTMSLADWNRCSRSFSRQCRTMRSRAGEMARPDSDSSGGSSRMMAAIVSALVSRLDAFFPASSS
jgi:hypothetical protein